MISGSKIGSNFFTAMPRGFRVMLGSIDPDGYIVLYFLVERYNQLQDQTWEAQWHLVLKRECGDSIPAGKNYQRHIYFVVKSAEAAWLGSKSIAYGYTCILQHP